MPGNDENGWSPVISATDIRANMPSASSNFQSSRVAPAPFFQGTGLQASKRITEIKVQFPRIDGRRKPMAFAWSMAVS